MSLKELSKHEKKDGMWKRFTKKWNSSLQSDKQTHFKLGILLGLSTISGYFWGIWGYFFALVLSQIGGYGLEVYQSTTKHRCVEANDAYATVAGSLCAWTVLVPAIEIIKIFL